MSSFKDIWKNYSCSTVNTPVTEITSNRIKDLINKRLIDNGLVPLDKIFGFEHGCPVCMNNYNSDNWIVLHPCGHLLCDQCLNSINEVMIEEGKSRKCPVCRSKSKWISNKNDNLRTKTNFSPQFPGTPSPMRRSFTYIQPTFQPSSQPNFLQPPGFRLPYQHRQMLDLDDRQQSVNISFLKSKPPIVDENKDEMKDESEQDYKVRSEISTRIIRYENSDRKIGNLSIVCPSLNRNENNNGIDLVIVMDVSGSMSNVAEQSCGILKYAVDSLSNRDRLCIITFDSDSKQLFPLQPMTATVKPECKRVIERCFTGGSTNLQSAIEMLIKVKEDGFLANRPFKVIILSDGQPDNGREGFHLVNGIYQGDIKPEVYSCTFGSSVKADTLKRLLLPDNMHYYRHIADMVEFKDLISELGLDKNVVIGTNLNISFRNVEVISPLVHNGMVNIDQIKTDDIFSLPLLFDDTNPELEVKYKDLQGNNITLEINDISSNQIGDFILHHFWYRKIISMIKEISGMSGANNQKIEKLNGISFLTTVQNLGEFLDEIKDLIEKTRSMINNVERNFHSFNTYTSTVERMSSHSSPTVNMHYRSYTAS